MLIKKIVAVVCMAAFTTSAFAMFCPNSFNTINIGDTIAQVTAQCGKPTFQKASTSSENQPQEWVYFVKMQPTDQATVKMTIGFDDKGLVTNMSVNGIGLTNSQICGGNTASVGATQSAIKAACGSPAYINQSNTPEAEAAVTKVMTLIYTGSPDVTLIFEDGVLKSRK